MPEVSTALMRANASGPMFSPSRGFSGTSKSPYHIYRKIEDSTPVGLTDRPVDSGLLVRSFARSRAEACCKSPYHISRRIGIPDVQTLLIVGELMLFLGLWIALWDIRNEFLLWLLGAGLLFLGIGLALE
jgi:hypothetical protein